MNEITAKGTVTELQCELFFVERQINVYLPLNCDSRSDMIVDINGKLKRIQVKSCHLTKEKTGIAFKTHSTYINKNETIRKPYTKEEVDLFATYYEGNVYLIPIEYCGKSEKTLSFSETPYAKTTLLSECLGDVILNQLRNGVEFEIFEAQNKKGVGQFTLDGKLVQIYTSYSEAAKALNKPSGVSHISQVANGSRKTAYGFIWKNI